MNDSIMPTAHRKVLLSSDTSRLNKIHLVTGWTHFRGWFCDWRWKGGFLRSRLEFCFEPGGKFFEAKSFDEDVLVEYKSGKEGPRND